jgi:hypothetical protein
LVLGQQARTLGAVACSSTRSGGGRGSVEVKTLKEIFDDTYFEQRRRNVITSKQL